MKKMSLTAMMMAAVIALTACGGSGTAQTTAATTAAKTETTAVQTEAAADLNTIEDGKLIMSTNAQFPPYGMLDDAGNVIGIDAEMAQGIADKLGLELVIDDMDFSAALLAVQQGKSDVVISGVTITDERKTVMEFSDSYTTAVQVVIVPEDSEIKSIEDMQGKTIGCQAGTTGYIFCSDTPENGGFGEEFVYAFDDGATAVQALLNGQIDSVVIDDGPAKEYVKLNPGLKILETEYVRENYAIGIAKGNTALVEAINKALAEMKADGSLQAIMDKYIK